MGALLFLALAYFAVGQAAANRNGAQGAADAAALAAASDARDQIGERLVGPDLNRDDLVDLVNGRLFLTSSGCAAADRFAAKNKANSESCTRVNAPGNGFAVTVRSRESVGNTVIPGTEGTYSKATARAVIESRCTLKDAEEEDETVVEIVLSCRGKTVTIDPEKPDSLPRLGELFTVRLVR
ncbi:hypothetical protein H3147_04865 [Streptomyces sp. OF8]|uniref:Putative Flp pilus-assembly TadG-like N-terminal domain-containing protein n=1 Tax=Streptomyces alkaliterrae TaxID=2213162 RepID=A0A5P0YYA0_9ACTN|nr:hypothetical protein [Streptomyces alkaliterrae]MQS05263.1 hypothetical protein [Streptomyces alkaliterrae]